MYNDKIEINSMIKTDKDSFFFQTVHWVLADLLNRLVWGECSHPLPTTRSPVVPRGWLFQPYWLYQDSTLHGVKINNTRGLLSHYINSLKSSHSWLATSMINPVTPWREPEISAVQIGHHHRQRVGFLGAARGWHTTAKPHIKSSAM